MRGEICQQRFVSVTAWRVMATAMAEFKRPAMEPWRAFSLPERCVESGLIVPVAIAMAAGVLAAFVTLVAFAGVFAALLHAFMARVHAVVVGNVANASAMIVTYDNTPVIGRLAVDDTCGAVVAGNDRTGNGAEYRTDDGALQGSMILRTDHRACGGADDGAGGCGTILIAAGMSRWCCKQCQSEH